MSVFKDKEKTKDGRQWRFKVYYHNADGKLVPYTSKRFLLEKEAKAEERVFILKELYEKNVISMQYIKSPILKEMITKGEIVTDNKLLTKPEYQYFDYLLNNSEFSDGKAIRNRYIHDAIIIDERTMTADYYTLLKVMMMIIIKINDDCCLNETIKEEGDFYEL